MTAKIIPFVYENHTVCFNSDGWLNATEIAERFGKRVNDWSSLPSTTSYISALVRALNTGKSGIYNVPDFIRTKRGKNGGTWIHPKLAVAFARWLSDDFAAWCDLRIDELLRGHRKPWNAARREAAIGYRGLCDAVKLNCELRGKAPARHHFINEARLINEVIAGSFAGRDRDQLSAAELEALTLAELRDTVLIGLGMPYAERKQNLLKYMRGLLGKSLEAA